MHRLAQHSGIEVAGSGNVLGSPGDRAGARAEARRQSRRQSMRKQERRIAARAARTVRMQKHMDGRTGIRDWATGPPRSTGQGGSIRDGPEGSGSKFLEMRYGGVEISTGERHLMNDGRAESFRSRCSMAGSRRGAAFPSYNRHGITHDRYSRYRDSWLRLRRTDGGALHRARRD